MIKIQTIEIKIRTNIPGERDSQPLTSSMFLFNKQKSPTALAPTTNYPYFRDDIPFTLDMLNGKTAYEFFFNQKAFLESVGTSSSDPSKKKTYAQENVIFLLKNLFLTSYPIEDNVEQSYETNILQTTSQVGRHSVIPEFITKLLFPTSSETSPFTYLSLSSGKYSVIGVTWINDVVNHPRYRKLMKEVIRFKDKKQKKLLDIEPNVASLSTKFYSKQAWQKRLIKLITEISGIAYTFRYNDTDVGFRRIKEWMDQQPWTNNSSLLSNDSNRIRERILILADYFSRFYKIQAQILEESSSYGSRSGVLLKLQSLPYFREFIEYSRDFIKQTQLKYYLSGDNTKLLLQPVTSRRGVSELHTALADDSDFCDMVNRVLAYVPDQTLNLKQPRYNPILKRLRVPDTNARILMTTNPDLQKAIETYLLNACSDEPFEQFADYLSNNYFSQEKLQLSARNEKTNQGENLSWMNTNVVRLTKDMYGIELQLELMQGMLDNKLIQQISCAFENKRLQSEYDRLKNKTDQVPLYLQQPRTLFSIESFLKPPAPLAAPPLAAPLLEAPPFAEPVNKKGGGGRKTRRRLRL